MKMGSHFFVSSHHTLLCHLIQSHLFLTFYSSLQLLSMMSQNQDDGFK